MKHLRTFCEWIVRKFSKGHNKRCFVTWEYRKTNTIGIHSKFRGRDGKIYHEIHLNEWHLALLEADHVGGTVLHECAHAIASGHGRRFRNACRSLGLEPEYQGTWQPKAHYRKGVLSIQDELHPAPRDTKRFNKGQFVGNYNETRRRKLP